MGGSGQLGVTSMVLKGSPAQAFVTKATQIDLGSVSVKDISCGFEHALVMTGELSESPLSQKVINICLYLDDGLLLATGINTDGQLGTGEDSDSPVFRPVASMAASGAGTIASIAAAADTTAVMTDKGDIWTFGNSVSPYFVKCRNRCNSLIDTSFDRSMAKPFTARR